MAANWMRRTLWTATACASVALLAACGSSETANSIRPDSIVTFGDAMSDLGQNPNGRPYSVSDGSTYTNWTREIAFRYNLTLNPAKAGGTAYAQGNARVALPDATGVTNAPSITAQIDSYLAANPTFGDKQFFLMSGGMSDVIAGYNEVLAGTKSVDNYLADMATAGKQMSDLVHRLHSAGAPRVLAIGTPNLGRTLWAKGLDAANPNADPKPTKTLEDATYAFNQTMLSNMVDLSGTEVLSSDVQYYFNAMTGNPGNYNFSNGTDPVCNTVDPTNGMNIGAGQINASLCTSDTLVVTPDKLKQYLFADLVNYTPEAHRRFGDWVYDRMKANW